jgi:hypothetical protein
MVDQGPSGAPSATSSHAPSYEPPRVERVLTPTDLEAEVRYAGDLTGQDDG